MKPFFSSLLFALMGSSVLGNATRAWAAQEVTPAASPPQEQPSAPAEGANTAGSAPSAASSEAASSVAPTATPAPPTAGYESPEEAVREPPPRAAKGSESQNPAVQAEEAQYAEPPLPPRASEEDADAGFAIPDFSVRVDPFNWLLQGRLGLELEVQAWKFISIELVPIFVTSETPPWFNFAGRDDNLSQHSDGVGPISGSNLAVGFWFEGKPFRGTVLRAFLTNYAYTYESRSGGVLVDSVGHTERHLGASIGSYSRYGAFIIGGEIGLGSDLNAEERCLPEAGSDCGELQLRALPAPNAAYYDLNGLFHPIYLEATFSLGVAL